MLGSLLLLHERIAAPPRSGAAGEGIDQLAFLVGGTWVAHPDPAQPTTTVEETCVWGPDNATILTSVVQTVNGEPQGTAYGMFSYDAETDRLESHSVSSTGMAQSSVEIDRLSTPTSWTFLQTVVQGTLTAKKQVTMSHTATDVLVVSSGAVPAPGGGAPGPITSLTYLRQSATA